MNLAFETKTFFLGLFYIVTFFKKSNDDGDDDNDDDFSLVQAPEYVAS